MYIGIDIGATHTRIAGNKSLDNISLVGSRIIDTSRIFGDGIVEILNNIHTIAGHVDGVGIGIAGRVSTDGRIFTHSTNLESWVNHPILQTIEKEFGCSVYLANDAVAQALGEAYFGDQPAEDFLYLVWGTGIGGAMISREVGGFRSTKLDGQYRHKWEAKFGGKNLETRFGRTAKELEKRDWDVIIREFADYLQDLSNILHINTIVIGGGIVEHQKERISTIIRDLPSPKIIFSSLGEDVGVIGGLALIKNNQ